RFEVFNLELGEGLAESYLLGRDEDEYDHTCHHLMVLHEGVVVGTYRLQTRELSDAGRGFYSATEFDLSRLADSVLGQGVEVGRACVAREHRGGSVLSMLWQGLSRYLSWHNKRYLFGCCSVTTTDRWVGRVLHEHLSQAGVMDPEHFVEPLSALECLSDTTTGPPPPIPPLFEGYLKLGARVCGPPAIDRLFGTVDFFVLLDLEQITPRAKRFLRVGNWQ
ncbi:MAG: putative hemolysin, partial [Myxococcota bacterium]